MDEVKIIITCKKCNEVMWPSSLYLFGCPVCRRIVKVVIEKPKIDFSFKGETIKIPKIKGVE